MKKIISLTLLLATLLLALASCSSNSVNYKTDVKTYSIYTTLSKLIKNNSNTYIYAIENKGFEDLGEKYQGSTHIKYTIGLNLDLTTDCFVETLGGNGCFEYGVFKATSPEAVAEIKSTLEDYITRLKNDELGLSYSPDNKLILDKASISVFGDYVVYVITPAEDSSIILTRTENLLTAE